MLDLSAFEYERKNLPNSDFSNLCYIKCRQFRAVMVALQSLQGTRQVSFCLAISSTQILQLGSRHDPKWLMKLSHLNCVLKVGMRKVEKRIIPQMPQLVLHWQEHITWPHDAEREPEKQCFMLAIMYLTKNQGPITKKEGRMDIRQHLDVSASVLA